MTDARKQQRAILPRLQDTRTAQVLGKTSGLAQQEPIPQAQQIGIWERVDQRMAEQGIGTPTDYWGQCLLKYISALELYAQDYDDAGQTEKAVQISMVLLKHTKEIFLAITPESASQPSAEELAAMEAEVAAMSDEELERGTKEQ